MNKSLQKTINQTFLQLIEDLKDKKDPPAGRAGIEEFFRDLMGDNEYEDLVKKLAVIYWLRKRRPMDIIQNNLGVDEKYINGVKPLMDKKGIKLAINYMEAEEFANTWSDKINKIKKI